MSETIDKILGFRVGWLEVFVWWCRQNAKDRVEPLWFTLSCEKIHIVGTFQFDAARHCASLNRRVGAILFEGFCPPVWPCRPCNFSKARSLPCRRGIQTVRCLVLVVRRVAVSTRFVFHELLWGGWLAAKPFNKVTARATYKPQVRC